MTPRVPSEPPRRWTRLSAQLSSLALATALLACTPVTVMAQELFTGTWTGTYTFGSMKAVLQQTGSVVSGQITDAAGCRWDVSGSSSGSQLSLPSWTLVNSPANPAPAICVGGTVTMSGTLASSHTTITGTGTTTLASGSTHPWTFTLTLTAVTRANLTIDSVTLNTTTASPGDSFTIAETVTNTGQGTTTTTSTVRYYLRPVSIGSQVMLQGSRAVGSVLPGGSFPGTVMVTVPSNAAPGSYFVVACADDLGVIQESNENDNCRATSTPIEVIGTLRLTAALHGKPLNLNSSKPFPLVAHVPLGAQVSFLLTDSTNQSVPATYSVDSQPHNVPLGALFEDKVIFMYANQPGIAGADFHAVHRGTATVTVTPVSSALSPVTFTVLVENPDSIGPSKPVDDAFFEVGHRTGIPPHFLKGHAREESGAGFNPFAYRYEPIGPPGDLLHMFLSGWRTRSPYEDYRLEAAPDFLAPQGLSEGARLSQLDIIPRSIYRIDCDPGGTGGRPIFPTDRYVTAYEIFRCNDRRQNWTANAKSAGPSRTLALHANQFTAQTTIASSYGLLQMMYKTAVEDMGWKGAGGQMNPSLLFDTFQNIQNGSASLLVGTEKVIAAFKHVWRSRPISSPAAFHAWFRVAWQDYNPKKKDYGDRVYGYSQQHLPQPKGAVLQ